MESTSTPKVIFLIADYGHDPTETAVPYAAFKSAGFSHLLRNRNRQNPRMRQKDVDWLDAKAAWRKLTHANPVQLYALQRRIHHAPHLDPPFLLSRCVSTRVPPRRTR